MARAAVRSIKERIRNYAQNAEFRFFQRQVPATITNKVDGVYGADRWFAQCSNGSDSVGFARVAESPTDTYTKYACQVRQVNATNRQFGIAQVVEGVRARELRGKKVTLSVKARTDGTEVQNIRIAIIEWSGTEDQTALFDISNANWAAQPTLNASTTYAVASSDLALTTSYQEYSVTATLSTSFNNLVIFVWTPVAEVQNDDFYITQIRLTESDAAVDYLHCALSFDDDLRECQRFYSKSYSVDNAPGSAQSGGGKFFTNSASLTLADGIVVFPVELRANPTITIYNGSSGTINQTRDTNAATHTVTGTDKSAKMLVRISHSGNLTANVSNEFDYTADAEI